MNSVSNIGQDEYMYINFFNKHKSVVSTLRNTQYIFDQTWPDINHMQLC